MKKLLNVVKPRFHCAGVWVGLISLVLLCIKVYTGYDAVGELNRVVEIVLPVLIAFGMISNPNENKE